jgi:DNA-binding beta-propeller fold protein YncE
MLGIVQSLDPNRYEPLMISDAEYQAVPAYRRWPCIVTINEHPDITAQVLAEARRNPAARVVTFGELGVGPRIAYAVIRPPAPEDQGPMPARGRLLYAVHYTTQRRGSGPGALHDQTDLAVDRAGHRYASDAYTNRITEWNQDGYLAGTWGDGGVLDRPISVAADQRGLLVVDLKSPGGRLVVFGPDRVVRGSYEPSQLGLRAPRQVAINANGEVVVVDEALPSPLVFDRDLNPLRQLAPPASAGEQRGSAVTDVGTAADGSVYLYSAAASEGWVRRYASSGAVTGEWATGVRGGHLAVAPNGSFWVSMAGAGGVVRFDAAGGRVAEFPAQMMLGGTGEGGIVAVAVDNAAVHVLWRYGGVVTYRVAE